MAGGLLAEQRIPTPNDPSLSGEHGTRGGSWLAPLLGVVVWSPGRSRALRSIPGPAPRAPGPLTRSHTKKSGPLGVRLDANLSMYAGDSYKIIKKNGSLLLLLS